MSPQGSAQPRLSPTSPSGARTGRSHAADDHDLADEHGVLLDEVRSRARAVRAAFGAGRWPGPEVEALVAYLRYEVLDQAVAEERLLFPVASGGFADGRIRRLVADHVDLRDVTGLLSSTGAANLDVRDPRLLVELLDLVEELLVQHTRTEQAVLAGAASGGVEAARRPFRCHSWFPVTEGPRIDLDALPREFADQAVLERFSRMRAGERLLLEACWDLDALSSLVARAWPHEFGWACLDNGPERWRAEVTRREPG